ncbi:type VII secretion protein EccCa [Corynebacterium callunae]|uniref:Ftsk domain-containing protein n=1 Tax=Corynebacterium callunae DSM 20147 TaxID=1121353 RepID=M1UXL4_9CORY|nr:type VII secretion protein EccCa [Corynebacterium callunae]AGG65988.1 Ftsk domain-containing protein [Corynebacterium callunae DSM 20147]
MSTAEATINGTAQATAATAQEIKKAPRAATLVGPGPDNEVFRQGDPARIGGYVVEPLSWAERDPAPHLPTEPLSAEPVPPAVRPTPKPLLKVLMPVIMVALVLAMVGLMVISNGQLNPMVLIFPLMMAMSLMMMFAPAEGDDTDETRRTYLRHLDALRSKALKHAAAQRNHQWHRHPDPASLWSRLGTARMWERAAVDQDCLEIRFGLGTTRLDPAIIIKDSGAPEDLDPVCAVSLRHTIKAVGSVQSMPVAVQLQAFRFIALNGPQAHDLARAIILQLLYHHGPETVTIKVETTQNTGADWQWLKWVPHTRDPDSARHRILVVDSLLTNGTEHFIDDPYWTTIINVGAQTSTALGQRAEEEGLLLYVAEQLTVTTAQGVENLGTPDAVSANIALNFARHMTAFRRPTTADNQVSGELLPLLGIKDIAQLDDDTMWNHRNSDPNSRLRVPLGLSAAGSPMILDLKESARGGMGPHGLCIGATGSGKSELLRTLVVGLSIMHSPAELNLVLVDFKGGATFLGCEDLPHTSAVITNLEEESILVERMHDAISGEMNRRQEQLRKAGSFANVDDYNNAAQTRSDLQPMPALLIVIDEFSELLGQHPDFADLFVAVGRLGRSLHIHLLLASQRLEEGRLRGLDSHLSYRIGLKTFSATESRQVLGINDAYQLPAQPGVGFLKSDVESITRFQASYISGPLTRRIENSRAPARVRLFNGWEQESSEVTIERGTQTLIDAVVARAISAGASRGLSAHQIWLPPLPAEVSIGAVAEEIGGLAAVIGMIDRPYQQRQDPLIIDFSSTGGSGHWVVCGSPQSGKSTALRSIVVSLAATRNTESIRFYILDFSAGALKHLARLPHVAGLAEHKDPERVRRLVAEVLGLVNNPEPRHTFLIVDGWHTITQDFEELFDDFVHIASHGLAARVHLVLSTQRWSSIRPAIRDLIGGRLELKLGEAMDSLIDRKAQIRVPAQPGRGLNQQAEQILIALTSTQDIAHVSAVAEAAGQQPVPQLQMLPNDIAVHELESTSAPGIPFARGGAQLSTLCWDPAASRHLLAFGSQGCGKSTLIRTVATGLTSLGRENARLVVFDFRRSHLGVFPAEMVAAYCASSAAAHKTISDLVTTLSGRLPGSEITAQELKERSWWNGPDIFLVIDDYDLLPAGLLHPLKEIIPHARDVGLHIVMARKAGGAARALYDPVLAEIKDQAPQVVLFSADREEGPILGIKAETLPVGRAKMQIRGTAVGMVQIARLGGQS